LVPITVLIKLFAEAKLNTPAFNQVLMGTFICPTYTDPMAHHLILALAAT